MNTLDIEKTTLFLNFKKNSTEQSNGLLAAIEYFKRKAMGLQVTQTELAKEFGISRQRASTAIKQFVKAKEEWEKLDSLLKRDGADKRTSYEIALILTSGRKNTPTLKAVEQVFVYGKPVTDAAALFGLSPTTVYGGLDTLKLKVNSAAKLAYEMCRLTPTP